MTFGDERHFGVPLATCLVVLLLIPAAGMFAFATTATRAQ